MDRPSGRIEYDNRGRVVLVTGGASGIGKAMCLAFAGSGATVCGLDVDAEAGAALPSDIRFLSVDVRDSTQCEEAVQKAVDEFGAVDVLINNAAIQPVESFAPQHEIPIDLLRSVIDVNVTGYALMARAVIPQMLKQRSGVIINLASAQAHRTAREVPAYGPTKAANLMQARQWAVEYARYGIRVVSISPGAIDTPLVRASLEMQGGEGELANRHPLGRLGRPEEIADAALWMASPGASFVTATDLEVDGGLGGFAAFADPYDMREGDSGQDP